MIQHLLRLVALIKSAQAAKTRWQGAQEKARSVGATLRQTRDTLVQKTSERAERGAPEAQFNLGERFYEGEGVPRDLARAVEWFGKAAQQGHARAQNNLGLMQFLGRGTARDPVEGCKWILLAAEAGDPKAEQAKRSVLGRLSPEERVEAQRRAQAWRQSPPDGP